MLRLFLAAPVGVASFGLLQASSESSPQSWIDAHLCRLHLLETALRDNLRKYWPQYADAKLYHHPPGAYGATFDPLYQGRIFGWKRTFRGRQYGDFIKIHVLSLDSIAADRLLIQEMAYLMGLQMNMADKMPDYWPAGALRQPMFKDGHWDSKGTLAVHLHPRGSL